MARTPRPWFYRQTGWWMCWFNGKKVKLAKGRKNRGAAQTRLQELQLEALKNPGPDTPEQTVASVIETYLGFAAKRLAPTTLERRQDFLQSFAEAHGWRALSECKAHHVLSWLDANQSWASDWTKHTAVRTIQTTFNWAVKAGIIGENPFRTVSQPTGLPRRDMTRDEFQRILRASGNRTFRKRPTPSARWRQLLIFLWYSGARPHEASSLKWSNVDFDRRLIVLRQHKTARTQSRPQPRVIPMHPVVYKLLRWLERRTTSEHVFVTPRRTPWNKNTLGCRLRRARQKAGVALDATIYGIRHAFGTRGVLQGCDIKTISALMGHTSTRITENYLRLAGRHEHLAAAMLRVNDRP